MTRLPAVLCLAACLAAQALRPLEQADEAFRQGDHTRAETLARQVLATAPNTVHAHMILGVIAAARNQWAVSGSHFTTVIKLDPANPHGYFYLGQAKLYQREWESAARYLSTALDRGYPDRDRALVELALARNETGRPDAALETLAKTEPPADPRLAAQYFAVIAFARAKLNDSAAAIESIRHAIEKDDANPQLCEFLIDQLIQTDQAPRALAEAIRAQRKFPDHPDILFAFALASYHVTESPLSRLALRNLREVDATGPRTLLAEGLLHRREGRNAEATASFRKAAAGGVPDAHLLLGILLRESGDEAGAEKEYREAERINPNNGQVLLEMGKLMLARGDFDGALTRLKRAADSMPSAPAVHYQLAIVYRRLNRSSDADRHFRLYQELRAVK
jgi:Flp pilus assembly protein TadD